jgi:hypothetical protein
VEAYRIVRCSGTLIVYTIGSQMAARLTYAPAALYSAEILFVCFRYYFGPRGSLEVMALGYKTEGRGFGTR